MKLYLKYLVLGYTLTSIGLFSLVPLLKVLSIPAIRARVITLFIAFVIVSLMTKSYRLENIKEE
ncbi:hypothetical protein QUF55_02265 [Clostridiaceae bacterium HSG29]|nr:hypothetical protein [Clostridiaceae bacterium HSG29]